MASTKLLKNYSSNKEHFMSTTKRYDTSKQWYAIHTYSGYEEKVAESIRQRAESLDMKDKIFQ